MSLQNTQLGKVSWSRKEGGRQIDGRQEEEVKKPPTFGARGQGRIHLLA
jgi:hypothetical protein